MATDYLGKYDLKDRVAVITGGGRDIGLACDFVAWTRPVTSGTGAV